MNQKDKAITKAVKVAVQEFDLTAQVVLFGSRARGDARKDSDYDFLVLINLPMNFQLKAQILDRLYEVELQNDCVLGVLVENTDYWKMLENTPLYSEITQDGVLV